jgi:hypothetical protein
MSKLEGISPKIPLTYSDTYGPYELNSNLLDTVRQNFRMLVLTTPGERIMLPDFGVGLRNFLFEAIDSTTFSSIVEKMREQIDLYMPMVSLTGVDFITSDEDPSLGFNEVRIQIIYNVLPLNTEDHLIINSTTTS